MNLGQVLRPFTMCIDPERVALVQVAPAGHTWTSPHVRKHAQGSKRRGIKPNGAWSPMSGENL